MTHEATFTVLNAILEGSILAEARATYVFATAVANTSFVYDMILRYCPQAQWRMYSQTASRCGKAWVQVIGVFAAIGHCPTGE